MKRFTIALILLIALISLTGCSRDADLAKNSVTISCDIDVGADAILIAAINNLATEVNVQSFKSYIPAYAPRGMDNNTETSLISYQAYDKNHAKYRQAAMLKKKTNVNYRRPRDGFTSTWA